jgi:hypothetical protein
LRIPTLLLVVLMAQIGWKVDQKLPRPPAESEAMVDSLAVQYYEAKFRFYPALATQNGVPGYDDKLSTYSQKSVFGLLGRIHNLGNLLSTLDEDSLSMGKWIEYKALLADMAAQRFILEDLELWRRRPTVYVDACVDGICLLHLAGAGRGVPVDLAPRLRMIPAVLSFARRNLRDPSEFHCRMASERLGNLIDMLKNPPRQVSSPEIDSGLLEKTVASLEAFASFLDSLSLTANSEFALGYDDFLVLSDTRNMISDMPEDTRAYARSVLERANEDLKAHASAGSTVNLGPSGSAGIQDLETQMASALDFIVAKGLASLPRKSGGASGNIKFLELPDFAIHFYPDVLYLGPTSDATEESEALLYVSPQLVEPGATAGGIVSSEVFPGRHLQALRSAECSSPVRRTHNDLFTVNGWILYSQGLMAGEGLGGDQAIRDALVRKRFYAAGSIAAVNMLLGEFTVEEAADFMAVEAGISEGYARKLAVQYAMEPELPISYIIGERQINSIRGEIESIQGEKFDLRVFHDSLLASGRLPLYLIRNNLVSGSLGRR